MATLVNLNSRFLVRYQINPERFSQVISIVTTHSVLLIAFLQGDGVEVLAQISLPQAVDPDQTWAFWDGDEVELTILKQAGRGASA